MLKQNVIHPPYHMNCILVEPGRVHDALTAEVIGEPLLESKLCTLYHALLSLDECHADVLNWNQYIFLAYYAVIRAILFVH